MARPFNWFWVVVILGLWLIVSPWVLGYSGQVNATWNAVIVGIIFFVVGLYGSFVGVGRTAPRL
jgi:hypothetical protein